MQLVINRRGQVRCLYAETIDLAQLGPLTIRRGSFVEPDEQGQWTADMSPVRGPLLGPFGHRSEALAAEKEWLEQHWLCPKVGPATAYSDSLAVPKTSPLTKPTRMAE